MKIDELKKVYKRCQEENADPVIFGDGNPDASILLVGEAPGAKEIEQGKPFVGQAGKNLDHFLEILELEREDIYITNVVKFRPYRVSAKTGKKVNRPPNRQEIEKHIQYLQEEIEIIQPKIIVTLGNVPLRALLRDDQAKIGDYHGKIIDKDPFFIFPLYHPASILYNRGLEEIYLEDLYRLKKHITEMLQ